MARHCWSCRSELQSSTRWAFDALSTVWSVDYGCADPHIWTKTKRLQPADLSDALFDMKHLEIYCICCIMLPDIKIYNRLTIVEVRQDDTDIDTINFRFRMSFPSAFRCGSLLRRPSETWPHTPWIGSSRSWRIEGKRSPVVTEGAQECLNELEPIQWLRTTWSEMINLIQQPMQ